MAGPSGTPINLIDEETLEAAKGNWDGDKNLGPVYGQLLTGRLVSQAAPYGQAASEKLRESVYYAPVQPGSFYQDYRKLTLKLWGPKATVVGAATAIRTAFDWIPKTVTIQVLEPGTGVGTILPIYSAQQVLRTMNFPPGVVFVRAMPLSEPSLMQDPATKKGEDVWILQGEWEIWTTRTVV